MCGHGRATDRDPGLPEQLVTPGCGSGFRTTGTREARSAVRSRRVHARASRPAASHIPGGPRTVPTHAQPGRAPETGARADPPPARWYRLAGRWVRDPHARKGSVVYPPSPDRAGNGRAGAFFQGAGVRQRMAHRNFTAGGCRFGFESRAPAQHVLGPGGSGRPRPGRPYLSLESRTLSQWSVRPGRALPRRRVGKTAAPPTSAPSPVRAWLPGAGRTARALAGARPTPCGGRAR